MPSPKRNAKIAIVSRSAAIGWLSYSSIVRNLNESYRRALGGDATFFDYPRVEYRADLWDLARQLAASTPRRIVFLDQAPFQAVFLHALADAYGKRPWPELVFHLDGDFSHRLREWLAVESMLRGKRCAFVCASARHAKLVARFLKVDTNDAFPVIPFPVDTSVFRADPRLRKNLRARLGIKAGDFAWLYAGRVTLQKNVHLLAERFARLLRHGQGRPRHLLLVGPADHLGANYFAEEYPLCFYERFVASLLENLPASARSRVHRINWADARDLAGYYNAADVLASLGLYHDEDYGMAVAEALACGTRALVTDWGGYAQFCEEVSDAGALVPVALTGKGLETDLRRFDSCIAELEAKGDSTAARVARAASLGDFCSIDAVAARLRQFHSQPIAARFKSSAALLKEHVFLFDSKKGIYPGGPAKGGLYEKVYSAYLR